MNIIVKRKLKDYEAWKKLVSEMDGVRQAYGSQGVTVYRNASDPKEVYLIFEWSDDRSYLEYFNRPDVQQALENSGTTQIIEVSEAFHLPY
jgi:quinol monooxygenase YgiN